MAVPALLVSRKVTCGFPAWVGTQLTTPVTGSIVMPGGAPESIVNVEGVLLPSLIVRPTG